MPGRWLDVTVTLRSHMVHWPDNPPVRITRSREPMGGTLCTQSALSLGSHTGTHMDAPLHFLPEGRSLDQTPPDATIGQARVIAIRHPSVIAPEELRPYRIRPGERILFKTRNSARCWNTDKFVKDFVYVSQEAARYLAGRRVRTVGVDYLSVGGFKRDGVETHLALLKAGVWIIEGLDLSRVRPGRYELLCLPLRIERSDGAPARAFLRRVAPDGGRS